MYFDQPYLMILYQAMFALMYYGLFRVGELAMGDHPVKACDVELATNKLKMHFILQTSKTHGKESRPQKVKITSTLQEGEEDSTALFCPFKLANQYMAMHGDYTRFNEQFFVFRD